MNKPLTDEDKRLQRMTDLASEEVRYLNNAGWRPVMVGPQNELMFQDPLSMFVRMRQGEDVLIQKKRDGFDKVFP